ncbi:MAG: chemotaxis protein CheW [Proteobacteria bacterium]|nr:chemotaxis protein CheW [Pseudomonadota bacterium]MBU1685840.1 chemotaxis protein CheW [Pseudomonadota bacterium]
MAEGLVVENTTVVTHEGKYLTFLLGKEVYGISIMKVREIVGIAGMEIHHVPNTPSYAKGVMKLRDKVIPVVSMRRRFIMEEIEYSERTCIVVVDISLDQGNLLIGVVVDSVSEVMSVTRQDIEPPPRFGTKLDTDYILGMAKVKGEVIILLDIDKVISAEELKVLETVS